MTVDGDRSGCALIAGTRYQMHGQLSHVTAARAPSEICGNPCVRGAMREGWCVAACAVFYEQQEARGAGQLQRAAAAGARLEELQARSRLAVSHFQAIEMNKRTNCQQCRGHPGPPRRPPWTTTQATHPHSGSLGISSDKIAVHIQRKERTGLAHAGSVAVGASPAWSPCQQVLLL